MAIIKDLDNSTTVVVNEDKNLWWSGLLFLIQTEATKTLLNLHLAAIKKVHASKDNFWSTNSLDIDCFRGQMPSEKKNLRKSMHRKHIVLMIMIPWSAKITFAQNEDPPQHTLPSFLRGQFSVISTLLMTLSSDGSGSLHCVTKGNIVWCAVVILPISCCEKTLGWALCELRIADES